MRKSNKIEFISFWYSMVETIGRLRKLFCFDSNVLVDQ